MQEILNQLFHTKIFWVTAVIVAIYAYLKYVVFNYWKRKGVPYETPLIPFGNALPIVLGQKSMGNTIKGFYDKYKKHRFFGIYMFYQPVLMINDPDLIRQVLIKEFSKFRDRGLYFNEEVDPSSANLFFLPGEKWKKSRVKLSPIFTSGKLKHMFPLFIEISDELLKVCNQLVQENDIVECKSLMGRYTTDTISSIAFGFDSKSLENPDNEFKRQLTKVFNQNPIKFAVGAFAPIILDILRIPFNPRDFNEFLSKVFEDMVNYRRENNVPRNDLLSLLIQLMDKGFVEEDEDSLKSNRSITGSDTEKFSMVDAFAEAFVFFAAGYETTSSTITYCLYELAMSPQIQDKVHAEIDEIIRKPGGLTYERIMNEFEYLQIVFSETLRKHPSLAFLNRLCIEDYSVPNSNYVIKKGTAIVIPVSGIQRDPNIYPDPDKFDPMRFSKENIAARTSCVYIPFGDGPRNCIGNRFGILQSKVALISVLSNYKFSICDKTPIPINYTKRAMVQTPEGGVYLKMEKRTIK